MSIAQEQLLALEAMAVCGAAVGLLAAWLSLLRKALRLPRAAAAFFDALTGVVFAAAVIATALRLRIDPWRWYALAGAAGAMGFTTGIMGTIVRAVHRFFTKISKKH